MRILYDICLFLEISEDKIGKKKIAGYIGEKKHCFL